MEKRESFYWNVVKGVAVFLMIWGHCIQYCALDAIDFFEDTAFKVIYTFHMPLFMLVSGYLFFYSFQKRNLKDLLAHRIQGLLHPIISATIVANILMLLPSYILSDQVDILFGKLFEGIEYNFWFLWAVLISSLVVGIGCKITDHTVIQLVMVVVGIFAVLLFPQWDMTLFMYPYFVVGFFCGMYRDRAKQIFRVIKYIFLPIFPVLVSFYENKHYIYLTPMYSEAIGIAASLEIATFRCVIGFVGSVCMLAIIEFGLNLGQKIHIIDSLLVTLSKLGKNSLQIYCLSVPLLSGYLPHIYNKIMEPIGYNLFAKNIIVYDWIFTPLVAVIWSAMLYCLVGIIRKLKIHKLIFGR